MGHVKTIDATSFDAEVRQADMPVLVDFHAAWCGPCKILSPVVAEIAAEAGDRYSVVKIDIDENQGLAMEFGIHSIPTLMVFKGGQAAERIVGVVSKSEIERHLHAHVS